MEDNTKLTRTSECCLSYAFRVLCQMSYAHVGVDLPENVAYKSWGVFSARTLPRATRCDSLFLSNITGVDRAKTYSPFHRARAR